MVATVTFYTGNGWINITGRIAKEYPKGLTVEDERGVIYYAPYERVIRQSARSEWLW